MIRRLSTASLSVALVCAAHAQTGANDVSEPERSVQEEAAEGLDAFVETAIQGGLLVPAENAEENPELEEERPLLAPVVGTCRETYPLDFSVVRSLRRFTELPASFDELDDADPDAKLLKDLQSKLALGLYAEAKALLALAPEENWRPYRKFISLMEGRARPDLAYFEELGSCHTEAELWLGIAQMVVFEPGGVDRIANQIARIRTLPVKLREDVATLIIPSLLIERRADLAQQIIATFGPEEVDNSTRLNALKTAILDMPDGSESDDRLVMLMSRPKLKLAALLILVERSDQLRPTVRSFVLEEAWNVLESNDTQHNLDPILAFVIDHLDSESLYSGLQRIRALPVADRQEVRASIDNYTVRALDGYLTDDNPDNALNALQTLTIFHSQLPLDTNGSALRKQGAVKALELGLFSMVKEFLKPLDRTPEIAVMLAEAAFWGHVNQDLFEVRDEFPTEAEINRMAGIRALQANLPAIATAAYTGLSAYPSKQLELIEEGAIVGNWALWNMDLAKLVQGLSDEEVVRLDRVRTIKLSKDISPDGAGREIRPYQIAGILESSRKTLAIATAGASNDQ